MTDDSIAEAQALEGQKLRVEQWNREATIDTIRHYAWGVGDDNPLWCDEEYAASTRYGTVLAPPTFLHSVFSGALGLGLPGIQPYGIGFKWTYLEPIRRGDRIEVDARVGPLSVHSGRHANRFVIQTTRNEYHRHDGTLIARSEGRTARVPRSRAAGGLSYDKREACVYTEDELEAIRLEAISEPRRGADPRFWEDVEAGETVPRVVKGPIDLTTMISYYAGVVGSPRTKGTEILWKLRTWARESPEKLPNNYDPGFFAEGATFTKGHVDEGIARQVGMPAAYNNGAQTTAWMAHAVLNWIGDDGFMTELETKLRRPAIFGDTLYCGASVVAKREPDIVEFSLQGENQLGQMIAEGRAEARLPSRVAATRGLM